MSEQSDQIRYENNIYPKGFGSAIRYGLDLFRGAAVCIVMADLSDSPKDLLSYYYLLKEGHECVFGSRFIKGSSTHNYPKFKLLLNRIANSLIQLFFGINHNDTTNAFKGYRRGVIEGIRPILSRHFNITVELPLKAMIRGFKYTKIPISWNNREQGISNFKIKEMTSPYLFTLGCLFLEKLLKQKEYLQRRERIQLNEYL